MNVEQQYVSLLLKKEYEPTLDPEKIKDEFLRSAYLAILECNTKPDLMTLINAGLNPVKVAKITDDFQGIYSLEKLEAKILKDWQLREFKKLSYDIKEMIDPEEVDQFLQAESSKIMNQTKDEIKTVADLFLPRVGVYEKRYTERFQESKIDTGIDGLDSKLHTFQEGKYIIIGARPSQGKTALMVSIAAKLAHKQAVGIISIESAEKEILDRFTCNLGRINSNALNSGMLKQAEIAKLPQIYGEMEKLNLQIIHPKSRKLSNIMILVKKLVKSGCKAIFIDYIQKIDSPAKTMREKMIEVSNALVEVVKNKGVSILPLAQAKRDADNRSPMMSDLQESAVLEQDADIIIFPHHEMEEGFDKKIKQSWLLVEKNRDGATGAIPVVFEKEYYNFY